MSSSVKYSKCIGIERQKPDFKVTEEIATSIGEDYRTLPIYEKSLYEFTYRNHYSLQNNELLKCRWREFKDSFESRVREPVQFPNIRDYHFFNCKTRFIPSISIFRRPDYRNKMTAGPGVDYKGEQMPIPAELFMKRGPVKNIKN